MIKLKKRCSAVLMSISSLPSPYGIGGFGIEFEKFIDFLSNSGFSAIQVLPFNLPDCGNSPYGSCSAFAGNYLYIDPLSLYEDGLLDNEELGKCVYSGSPYTVDYGFVYTAKQNMLSVAFKNGFSAFKSKVLEFLKENSWVLDYALYMAIKEKFDGAPWQKWDLEFKDYNSAKEKIDLFEDRVNYYCFEQYLFSKQYFKAKKYAESKGIAIIGDMPIYVSSDSVDVWKNPKLFCLDDDYIPTIVAGVPPDAFSKEGQLWGNPVYNWKMHEKDNFSWWISRLERNLKLYDVVRIDHFRAFASYYTINVDAKDAKNGSWEKGPGMKLFGEILKKFSKERIIAEDLGTYGEDVVELLKTSEIKGMRVVQFGFADGDSTHLPHNYSENSVAYIGTHDNNTLLGWLWEMDDAQRSVVLDYCGFKGKDWGEGGYKSESCRAVIETVFKSSAPLVVIPFQDLCGFGADARMNIPGVPKDNWRFRTTAETVEKIDKEYFSKINRLFFR